VNGVGDESRDELGRQPGDSVPTPPGAVTCRRAALVVAAAAAAAAFDAAAAELAAAEAAHSAAEEAYDPEEGETLEVPQVINGADDGAVEEEEVARGAGGQPLN
jgi:hypothetical protein